MADQQKKQKWTVVDLLNWTTEYLSEKEFSEARLNAERLLGHVLGLERIELYTNFDRPLIPDELAAFKALLKRRLAHEPLQYILGETEFFSLPFKVSPAVLIPRPETEILVEHVIELCQHQFADTDELFILDVGTGTGCIAVSLAKHVENAVITAVDISHDALTLARGNAEAHDVSINFKEHDALKPWPTDYLNTFDIIVCNPPYVSFPEYQSLQPEIKEHEPKISLLGGNDGLEFYRKFANISTTLIKSNGYLFFEIGERQASSVKNIYAEVGFSGFQVFEDLAGKDRVLRMLWKRSGNERVNISSQ